MSRRAVLIIVLLAGLSISVYQIASLYTFRVGFPLDDAWIHQTYARNLAERGEWAFLPGIQSAGSTAPMWTSVMALGQLLGINAITWANLVGLSLLV